MNQPAPSDELVTQIRSAVDGMRATGPEPLVELVAFKLRRTDLDPTEADVIAAITTADKNSSARKATHMALAQWDAEDAVSWGAGTDSRTAERRAVAYELLDLSDESRAALDAAFPIAGQRDVVIAEPGPWDPWYTKERRAQHDFYWSAYAGVLERKGWSPDTIAGLDAATSDIIGRLAEPTSPTAYQSKGLVVGYVQSGKTANFTGITAKAIDAGYRLIIVLTGTIELLRGQTQRRLDMELIGEENILGGRDRTDPAAIRDVDYVGQDHDADWYADKFLKHGLDINSALDIPSIKRLTSAKKDYRRLGHGLDTLDFRRTGELREPTKPLFDPVNLFGADVRIAIVKKNTAALNALIRDLKDIHASAAEIPALIIDDEADQASVNTTNPNRPGGAEEARKRTAINKLISEMLTLLPRSQYLGYTATPFANVFVSPDDSEDIFPKDFIVSLEPSGDYMGGKQFHDLATVDPGERTPSTSNEAAFVRNLYAADDDAEKAEILKALDAFVLSGAIKRWRMDKDPELEFRHHTMLVHQSVRQVEHKDLAELIREVWGAAEYSGIGSMPRLRALLESDFRVVHDSRDWATDFPETFDELKPFIADTVAEITADGDPVVIVNGSRDSDYDAMDFQRRPYWRVMVGGAKLSRGFTVEGLTVSYYRRRAAAADTLMQMGRWFGYRPGYKDLVRLYIARDVVDGRGVSYDLYDMFTSILEDEEEFREQLRAFSKLDPDGRPLVLPRNVPPMVFSQLTWLKPTGANRMYNAELTMMARGGQVRELPHVPARSEGKHAQNFELAFGLVDDATSRTIKQTGGEGNQFEALVSFRSAAQVLEVLNGIAWASEDVIPQEVRFILDAMEQGTLEDWAIIWPASSDSIRQVGGHHNVPLVLRSRRPGRPSYGAITDSKHRGVAQYIAGVAGDVGYEDGELPELRGNSTARGAILLYFGYESAAGIKDPRKSTDHVAAADVVPLISLVYPYKSAPRGRIAFRVKDANRPDAVIVPVK